ncbi:hypothetical protein OEA41_006878 [Lepraria neglecta]|uniref:Cytochrome P450 n=1 Tax=Lepraria neglecta TaxID=209136 RepID=A0AAE0DNG6_9LECA|nr:hypothetical protein OEA41_006878 [Lepraria neglecta]
MAAEADSSTLFYVTAAVIFFAGPLGYFFTRLYHVRMLFLERQKRSLPVAPGYLKNTIDALPEKGHYQYAFGDIARHHFSNEGVFYLDLWPVSGLFLTVVSPQVAVQCTQTNSSLAIEKPALLPRFFKPITDGPSLFDMPEREWKPWRAAFNKGFSHDHILSLIPGMAKETRVYCSTLRKCAQKGDLVHLDPITLRFTMDLIGQTILNTSLGAQKGYNTLADCMLSQICWHQPNAENNPFEYLNFARWYMHWWNGRQMNDYIGKELDKRYNEYKADAANTRSKAVIDIVLQAYMPEDAKTAPVNLDPEFRAFAIRQIRLFVFAGHDSTSSTICYILHLLATNREALTCLRAEHDAVFGKDPAATQSLLETRPQLTESLPYTTAIIKETLRLFTPASSSRAGKPHTDITDDAGNRCPTDDATVFYIHVEMHRSPKYWVRPDEFLPEHWLVDPGHKLYPMKGAWRSFEHGPRNCIAQGLVMTELRVVLAMVVRQFYVKPAYEEWDLLHPSKGLRTYRGERVYQIEEGAAHPADKYPCRVYERGSSKPV